LRIFRSSRTISDFGDIVSLEQVVLHGFLELSESSKHFAIASGRFLSISGEIAAEYERNMTGISIDFFG
jgi:hypothetical protein